MTTTAEKMVEIFTSGKDIIINEGNVIQHKAIKDIVTEGTTVTFKSKKTGEILIINFENVAMFLYK